MAMDIDISQLLALDTEVNEVAKQSNLPFSVAAFSLFSDIRMYNKIGKTNVSNKNCCPRTPHLGKPLTTKNAANLT
jgi:hypothetical protein